MMSSLERGGAGNQPVEQFLVENVSKLLSGFFFFSSDVLIHVILFEVTCD